MLKGKWHGILCVQKKRGRLGVDDWNKASIMRHTWNLFVKSGSLWVAWIKMYLLRGKSFWQVKMPSACSWSWRKILKIREEARDFIHYKVGIGKHINV